METPLLQNRLRLSEEQYESIEKLAALNYTLDQMAMFLEEDPAAFRQAYDAENSLVKFHVTKGKLETEFKIGTKITTDAEAGSMMAVALYRDAVKKNNVEDIKRRILYHED